MIGTSSSTMAVGAVIITLFVFAASAYATARIEITDAAKFTIYVNEQPALSSAGAFFTVDGKRYSTGDNLKLIQVYNAMEGYDVLGMYTKYGTLYRAGTTDIKLNALHYYNGFIVFEQHFISDATKTSMGDANKLSSGYPSFNVHTSNNLGFLSYGGNMAGNDDMTAGKFTLDADINGGIKGGPLILFDSNNSAIVLSSFNHFMVSSQLYEKSKGILSYGLLGSVENVPMDFYLRTILYVGNTGINDAMASWGEQLRKHYDRTLEYRLSDLTLNYLGFWTDGGAFYFYNTEPGKNYEETILQVKDYATRAGLPYQYVQYDSWWYFKDNSPHNKVTKWEPMPTIFPHGLRYMWDKTRWPASCHNREWSAQTPYAKQNGGHFNFVVEKNISLPQDPAFWEYLFNEGRHWGLITYEQDHMDQQFSDTMAIQTDVNVGRDWLLQMGNGARKNGLTIQYCMSLSKHLLQSLEIPVVTHARASGDYRPGEDNWKIGVSSIFTDAIGVAPFKDNFFTSSKYEPGNTYKMRETHAPLQCAVATLSTGPVAPSDKVGYTNVPLLMKCCNSDGLILKPSRPAKAIDAQIKEAALKTGKGPNGEVWSTYSVIGGFIFGIVLAADMKNSYNLSLAEIHYDWSYSMSYTYYEAGWNQQMPPKPLIDSIPITTACGLEPFCLYYITPVIKLGSATHPTHTVQLLGELSKWVPMSPHRVYDLDIDDKEVNVYIRGGPQEDVVFFAVVDNKWRTYECLLSKSGTTVIHIFAMTCF